MQTSFAHFRRALQAPLAGFALLIAGCATLPPPTAELDAARQAVARAEAADADQYAADDVARAREALSRAQAAMTRGRDAEAREAALAAAADADLARVRSTAETTRAEFRQQQEGIAGLRDRLQMEGAPVAMDPFGQPMAGAPPAQRLQALDADPRLNPFAQYERLQARQALVAVDT
ncbi:MAG: DUF4398 domain-containing protein, partial [Thermomonas sp.]